MQTNEKDPSALQCQTDRKENAIKPSIPQASESMHLSIEMEPTPMRDPIGIDNFIGSARSFKRYLRARRIFLAVGIIA